jgi:hypothetical protein
MREVITASFWVADIRHRASISVDVSSSIG